MQTNKHCGMIPLQKNVLATKLNKQHNLMPFDPFGHRCTSANAETEYALKGEV